MQENFENITIGNQQPSTNGRKTGEGSTTRDHVVKDDFVYCAICGKKGQKLYRHIKAVHNITIAQYRILYPNVEYINNSLRNSIKINMNSGRNTINSSSELRKQTNNKISIAITESLKNEELCNSYAERIFKGGQKFRENKDSDEYKSYLDKQSKISKSRWDSFSPEEKVKEINKIMSSRSTKKVFTIENKEYIFRSYLEYWVAKSLILNKLDFEYEPFHIILENNSHYIPDFYVAELDIIIEAKGKKVLDKKKQILINNYMIKNSKKYLLLENCYKLNETELKSFLDIISTNSTVLLHVKKREKEYDIVYSYSKD